MTEVFVSKECFSITSHISIKSFEENAFTGGESILKNKIESFSVILIDIFKIKTIQMNHML
jgi:hypothetical protein